MRIFVWTGIGKQFVLELDEDATVEDLFDKGKSMFGIKKGLKIIYKGREIVDGYSKGTLINLGFTDNSTIRFLSRPIGGGGGCPEAKKLQSVKEFTEKLEEYKPENEDENISIRYYKAQSGHSSLKDEPFEVVYEIDEDLEDDWIQNIKKGLNSISMHAPGIKFTKHSDVQDKICPCGKKFYRIKFCKIDIKKASTHKNIYNQNVGCISLGNTWTNLRFGTAMHETLHAIGFHHEHCRKDRDEHVDVYTSDSQYIIKKGSQELTAFDPFSIMFYGENKGKMKRASNTGIFKLK